MRWLALLWMLLGMMVGTTSGQASESYMGYPTTASPEFKAKELSYYIAKQLESHKKREKPLVFFVQEDGSSSSWRYCLGDGCTNEGDTLFRADFACRQSRLASRCFLHMRKDQSYNPDIPVATEPQRRTQPAAGLTRHGPTAAKGLLIYLPGFSGYSWNRPSFHRDDEFPIGLPQGLHPLGQQGWDADVLVIRHVDRIAIWDEREQMGKILTPLIDKARADGYRRVVLVGLSRGGIEVLWGLQHGARPDAAMVFEPAFFGPESDQRRRKPAENEKINAELIEAFGKAGEDIPLLAAWYQGSYWFRALDSAGFEKAIAARKTPGVAIANPPELIGHLAISTNRHHAMFGRCMAEFAETGKADCTPEPAPTDDPALWATEQHLQMNGLNALTRTEVEAQYGRVWCSDPWGHPEFRANAFCIRLDTDKHETFSPADHPVRIHNLAKTRWNDKGQLCRQDHLYNGPGEVCQTFYLYQDRVLFVAREDGTITARALGALPPDGYDFACKSDADQHDCTKLK